MRQEHSLLKACGKGELAYVQECVRLTNTLELPPPFWADEVFSSYLLACRHGFLGIVKCLVLEGGVDLKRENEDGYTGLHSAIAGANLEVVQWLISEGHCEVESKTSHGYTCYQVAAHHAQLAIIQWLGDAGGADTTAVCPLTGNTALHQVIAPPDHQMQQFYVGHAAFRSFGCARWLVQQGGFLPSHRNANGDTALLVAARAKSWRIAQWLLQHGGADINEVNNGGGEFHHPNFGNTIWELFSPPTQHFIPAPGIPLLRALLARGSPPRFIKYQIEGKYIWDRGAGPKKSHWKWEIFPLCNPIKNGEIMRKRLPDDSEWRNRRKTKVRESECSARIGPDAVKLVLGYAHLSEDELWHELSGLTTAKRKWEDAYNSSYDSAELQ
jgi:hypothetical protein